EDTQDTASYYSFYDVMDKLSTVMGTFMFGFVEQITGGMRNSVASLAVLFVISLVVLMRVRVVHMEDHVYKNV
ncbi:MAG: MFS transporter, partial [Saprospiraceae bacterium]|nr:MFS transporter [Saprospiraceae bacterium]